MNSRAEAPEFDTSRPHPARVYDFLLGGKDNYEADRAAAEKILSAAPEFRDNARANRAFLTRAVRHLARDKGITQYLDIGTGIPTAPNVHQTAAKYVSSPAVLYADHDPIIYAHANALLAEDGMTSTVLADIRNPDKIIAEARRFLDFTRPVALLLVAVLHFIPDADDPAGIVAAYRDALPPGSYLVLSHGTTDFHSVDVNDTARSAYETGSASLALRPKAAIEAFFDGFTLEPPYLVQAPFWQPDTTPEPDEAAKIGIYAAVAAKN